MGFLTPALFSAPRVRDELFFQYAYNQLNTEVQFQQVSKNTPLYLKMLLSIFCRCKYNDFFYLAFL